MQVKTLLTERAGTLGRDIWSNAIIMKTYGMGGYGRFFAFSFPCCRRAFFRDLNDPKLASAAAENEYTAKLLDQSRSVMPPIQNEFSLTAQIRNISADNRRIQCL
jgi:hypothetical protein